MGDLADLSDPLPDDELVTALKEAERTGRPVELVSQTTETSISYAQPDGTVEVESAAGPVRTRVDGEWVDVDVTLELTDAGVRPVAVTGEITFSAGGEQPMAILGDGEGTSLTLEWPAELPKPELQANTATYRDVLPDVDLVLTATRLGFEQHLVVNERPDAATVEALASLEFPTTAEGATVTKGAGGQLQVIDEAGDVAGTAAAPLMWDARTDPRTDEPVAVEQIGLEVAAPSAPATDATLVLTPPTAFLTDPATVYPVVIDPTQALGALGDTFVQTGISSPQGGSTELRSGSWDAGATRARSLLRFDVGAVKNRVVQSATLSLFEHHSPSCLKRWVDIRDAGDFDPATVAWGNQPWIGGIVANAEVALGYSSSCPANWVNFGLTGWTKHYADTRNGKGNVMPLAIQVGDETDSLAWKKFHSGNAAGNVPVLNFSYDGWCDQYNGNSICGGIRDRWWAAGGPNGFLGLPTTGDTAVSGGWYNHFQGGSIYYSSATGAHIVTGGIRAKWAAQGWEAGPLGFPTTSETCANGGCYNHFQGGSIFWSPSTGAQIVWGAIRNKWAQLGWERSYLGFPTTSEICGNGGCYSHFQGGSIYWSSSTGAHPIRGAIRDKWASLGAETSYLGFPTTDETAVTGGAYNHFTGGSIYWSAPTGAHTIRGAIRDKWASLGWETSYLGFPTTDETATTGGAYHDFTGGSIYSSASSGAYTITGRTGQLWRDLEGANSFLGFPVSDAYSIASGTRQDFTSGQIVEDAATLAVQECTITGTDGVDNLAGTSGPDIICALAGDDVIDALDGADRVFAGSGNDVVAAGLGEDVVIGGGGRDDIQGGADADILVGDEDFTLAGTGLEGADTITGGPGADDIAGDGGPDLLLGEDDADTIRGGEGDDTIEGGRGDDLVDGQGSNDTMRGDEGNDSLTGGSGADALAGGDGQDRLTGSAGPDVITGGAGGDVLSGGVGTDQLTGNEGADALDGGPSTDSVNGGLDTDSCVSSGSSTDLSSCEDVHENSVADMVTSYVNALAPDLGAAVTPQPVGAAYVADTESAAVTVPLDPHGQLRIVAHDTDPNDGAAPPLPELAISLPATVTHGAAVLTDEGSVVYEDSSGQVGIDVQASQSGNVRVSTVINSPTSPNRYRYAMTLPTGGSLELTVDGGVSIVGADGVVIGGVEPGWARDAAGVEVATHYEIDGTSLIQVLDLTNKSITFPVVADPTWGSCANRDYGIRHPGDEHKRIADYARARGTTSTFGISAGTSALYCGWQGYEKKTSGFGFRHINASHNLAWYQKAVGRHCCQWRYAADYGIGIALRQPQVVIYRSYNKSFCYSARVDFWFQQRDGTWHRDGRYYFARVAIRDGDGAIITSLPADSHCAA